MFSLSVSATLAQELQQSTGERETDALPRLKLKRVVVVRLLNVPAARKMCFREGSALTLL